MAHDVINRAIINGNSNVSGRKYDILSSTIAHRAILALGPGFIVQENKNKGSLLSIFNWQQKYIERLKQMLLVHAWVATKLPETC